MILVPLLSIFLILVDEFDIYIYNYIYIYLFVKVYEYDRRILTLIFYALNGFP